MNSTQRMKTFMKTWLIDSKLCTAVALSKQLRIHTSAISHWTIKNVHIPRQQLLKMHQIYPIDAVEYFSILAIHFIEMTERR